MVPLPSATNRLPASLNAIPSERQVPAAGTTNPTGIRLGLWRLVCQNRHGGGALLLVYKLRGLSAVNRWMRRGVVIRVVTVAFFGNGSLSSSSPHAERPPGSGTD